MGGVLTVNILFVGKQGSGLYHKGHVAIPSQGSSLFLPRFPLLILPGVQGVCFPYRAQSGESGVGVWVREDFRGRALTGDWRRRICLFRGSGSARNQLAGCFRH